jgi:hypothetical protein
MGKCALLHTKAAHFPMKAAHLSPDRPRCFPVVRYWRKAPQHDAGTERYLTRFLVRQEYTANDEPASCGSEADELRWFVRQLKSTNSGNTENVKSKRIFAPRIISDHIMVQEDFERLHKFLLETEGLSEVSDDMRELVEEEWPELVHKLPPKVS